MQPESKSQPNSQIQRMKANAQIQLSSIFENKKPRKTINEISQLLNPDSQQLQRQNISYNINDFNVAYRTLETIGSGCTGTVKKAQHKKTGAFYAVKFTPTQSEEVLKKLIIEFTSMKTIHHENIVQVIYLYIDYADAVWSESRAIMVMDFVKGKELQNQLEDYGRFDEQILSSIKYLHSKGICHRDLKPQNILYCQDKKLIKIIDFNISQFQKTSPIDISKLQMWTQVGTLAFTAPEILHGVIYNFKVDIWSVGCILYFMLSGIYAFKKDRICNLMDEIKNKQVEFSHSSFRDVSFEAKDLILKLLEKNPSNRISSEQALAHNWFNSITPTILKEIKYKVIFDDSSEDQAVTPKKRKVQCNLMNEFEEENQFFN